jgi:hypothetical protein
MRRFPPQSPSHPAGAFAPLVNPVFSDVSDASSLSYYQSRLYAESGANHLLALNAFGFHFRAHGSNVRTRKSATRLSNSIQPFTR